MRSRIEVKSNHAQIHAQVDEPVTMIPRMEKPSVASVLDALMRERGIGPTDLSRRSGVPQSTITRIRAGAIRDPRDVHVSKLAQFFGVTVEAMRGRADLASSGAAVVRQEAQEVARVADIDGARRLLLKATETMDDDQLLQLIDAANSIRRGAAPSSAAQAVRYQAPPTTTEIFAHQAAHELDQRFSDDLFIRMGVPREKIESARKAMISWYSKEADERKENLGPPPGRQDMRGKLQAGS